MADETRYATVAELARSWRDPELLVDLVRVSLRDVRLGLAANRYLPERAAVKLAGDRSVEVRSALARNPEIGAAAALRLARDSDGAVRETLFTELLGGKEYSWSPSFLRADEEARTQLLEHGASDASARIRTLVASYERTGQALLEQLASDHDRDVRAAVARNPASPDHLLGNVAADTDEDVVAQAASNPLLPDDLLSSLADSGSARVRAGVAANPASSPDRLVVFLDDTDPRVQAAAARNPRAPLSELADLIASLPQNPPSHKGPRMPYAPVGSLRDYVEDGIARQLRYTDAHCACGEALEQSSFAWMSPQGEHDRFFKLRCLGACGRDWRLPAA